MTPKTKLVAADGRRRLALSGIIDHDLYIATAQPGGLVTLTPVVAVPVADLNKEAREAAEAEPQNIEPGPRLDA